MSQYCDSKALERNWFHWILGNATPSLEKYRKHGLLWTRILGLACIDGKPILKSGRVLYDPSYPERWHCIAFGDPVYLESYAGQILNGVKPEEFERGLDLTDESNLHALDQPFRQSLEVIPSLLTQRYIKEQPTCQSWHAILTDIHKICEGISTKFHLNEQDQHDLAQEAFVQVLKKLTNGKLVYMPGRAPVFNLLTTTTYNIMFSILNRSKNQREGLRRLLADASDGILPQNGGRSVRVPAVPKF